MSDVLLPQRHSVEIKSLPVPSEKTEVSTVCLLSLLVSDSQTEGHQPPLSSQSYLLHHQFLLGRLG